MKIFLIKASILSVIVVTVFLYLSHLGRPVIDPAKEFLAAIIDKHERLNTIKQNRLLLVGGSNLAFGVDSEKLENCTNFQVVNVGLHAGLGTQFILNEVIPEIKPRDVVLLSFEYHLFDDAYRADPGTVKHANWVYPPSISYYRLSVDEQINVLHKQFKRFFDKPIQYDDPVYARTGFNKYGDIIAHTNLLLTHDTHYQEKIEPIREIGSVEKFRALSDRCKELDAQLYIVFPNYPKEQYQRNKVVIEDLHRKIQTTLDFIPIVGTPETFLVDYSELFDTVYHLNGKGRERRTEILIQLLKENDIRPR